MSSATDLLGSIGILRRLRCRFGWHGEISYGQSMWRDARGMIHWDGDLDGRNPGLNICMTCNALFDGQPWKPGKMIAPSTMTFLGWNSREYYRRYGEEPDQDATSMLWRIGATFGLIRTPKLSVSAGTMTGVLDLETGEMEMGPFGPMEENQ